MYDSTTSQKSYSSSDPMCCCSLLDFVHQIMKMLRRCFRNLTSMLRATSAGRDIKGTAKVRNRTTMQIFLPHMSTMSQRTKSLLRHLRIGSERTLFRADQNRDTHESIAPEGDGVAGKRRCKTAQSSCYNMRTHFERFSRHT